MQFRILWIQFLILLIHFRIEIFHIKLIVLIFIKEKLISSLWPVLRLASMSCITLHASVTQSSAKMFFNSLTNVYLVCEKFKLVWLTLHITSKDNIVPPSFFIYGSVHIRGIFMSIGLPKLHILQIFNVLLTLENLNAS